MSRTLALACSALALCFTLSLVPAAQADDMMMKKDTMMHKGGMKKHKKKDSMMSHDMMKKDAPAQ